MTIEWAQRVQRSEAFLAHAPEDLLALLQSSQSGGPAGAAQAMTANQNPAVSAGTPAPPAAAGGGPLPGPAASTRR